MTTAAPPRAATAADAPAVLAIADHLAALVANSAPAADIRDAATDALRAFHWRATAPMSQADDFLHFARHTAPHKGAAYAAGAIRAIARDLQGVAA